MTQEDFKGINFCRIKELKKYDKFLYMGLWKEVTRVTKSEVRYRELQGNRNYGSAPINSMQFVEVIKAQ